MKTPGIFQGGFGDAPQSASVKMFIVYWFKFLKMRNKPLNDSTTKQLNNLLLLL